MEYLLLKNGHLVTSASGILKNADILSGNGRIMEIGHNIKVPNYQTRTLDLNEQYVLPGMIHYLCPFIRQEERNSLSIIDKALAQGATAVLDHIKKSTTPISLSRIKQLQNEFSLLLPSFGFHLSLRELTHQSKEQLISRFAHSGCTSMIVRWKHIELVYNDEYRQILQNISDLNFLLIIRTEGIKQSSLITRRPFFKAYLNRLKKTASYLQQYRVNVLFTEISSHEEIAAIQSVDVNNPEHISMALLPGSDLIPSPLTLTNIIELGRQNQFILQPPTLTSSGPLNAIFPHNSENSSFIKQYIDPISLEENLKVLIEMYATRPAKLLGMHPKKGGIIIGADTDLIIWNPAGNTQNANSLLRHDIKYLVIRGAVVEQSQLIMPEVQADYLYRFPVMAP
ncbi:hypothetical protein ACT3CD_05175 [Geofilum sp. OHC36d9]|uniref:hypothetical protein n=1 Tax=Geofilum sp. OHC36d9 TaxID=3458413 RepID=UPI004033EB0D